jgi:hypothetical protein
MDSSLTCYHPVVCYRHMPTLDGSVSVSQDDLSQILAQPLPVNISYDSTVTDLTDIWSSIPVGFEYVVFHTLLYVIHYIVRWSEWDNYFNGGSGMMGGESEWQLDYANHTSSSIHH